MNSSFDRGQAFISSIEEILHARADHKRVTELELMATIVEIINSNDTIEDKQSQVEKATTQFRFGNS